MGPTRILVTSDALWVCDGLIILHSTLVTVPIQFSSYTVIWSFCCMFFSVSLALWHIEILGSDFRTIHLAWVLNGSFKISLALVAIIGVCSVSLPLCK